MVEHRRRETVTTGDAHPQERVRVEARVDQNTGKRNGVQRGQKAPTLRPTTRHGEPTRYERDAGEPEHLDAVLVAEAGADPLGVVGNHDDVVASPGERRGKVLREVLYPTQVRRIVRREERIGSGASRPSFVHAIASSALEWLPTLPHCTGHLWPTSPSSVGGQRDDWGILVAAY